MDRKISKWLKSGKQSEVTPKIKKICSKFKGNELEKIYAVLNWIDNNLTYEENGERIQSIFATRTAQQIIDQGKGTGCHDTALVAVTFLRTVGIPTKYVLGIDKSKPDKGGHCVAESCINGKWVVIDPSYFQINLIPIRSNFYRENYIIKKGFDSWDCKVKTMKDWHLLSNKLIKKLKN